MIKSNDMPRQVLLIDDDQDEAILLIAALKEDGMPHVCNWASDVIMGLEMLDNMTPEIILIDYQMPGHNGLDGIRLIRAQKHLAAISFFIQPMQVIKKRKRSQQAPRPVLKSRLMKKGLKNCCRPYDSLPINKQREKFD